MLDRAKVVLFDWLGSRLAQPGYLPPIAVLDLFAGAGTLGIECLSRGASYVCFIEKGGLAIRALQENIAALDARGESTVLRRDAISVELPMPPEGQYSLIFFDPPYRMTQGLSPGDPVVQRLVELGCHPAVASDAWLVVRQEYTAGELPPVFHWDVVERRIIGKMAVTFLTRSSVVSGQ
jgi:16S rRNA (guanine966-N2)-methyltransferase